MTAVEELALRIWSGNVDPTRVAAILENACAGAVALAAQRFEATLDAMTISLTSELAVPTMARVRPLVSGSASCGSTSRGWRMPRSPTWTPL